MNRKLLNGLLVLAVAAGGVGTFTSCKDENFGNDVNLKVSSLEAQLAAIRDVTDIEFQNKLQAWLDSMTDTYSDAGFANYYELCQAADKMYDIYKAIMNNTIGDSAEAQQYVKNLYDWMYHNFIQASDWYNLIYAVADRVGSVEINQTYNPMFGSVNLPIGLKTTVLASYVVDGGNTGMGYKFPENVKEMMGNFSPITDNGEYDELFTTLETLAGGITNLPVESGLYTSVEGQSYGNMGSAYITVNPLSADLSSDKYTLSLVNSAGQALNGVTLNAEVNTDELSFGYVSGTRADATGIYKVKVDADENFDGKTIDLMDEAINFKDDVVAFARNKTLTNLAYIGEELFKKLNDIVPAYGVQVSWNEEQGQAHWDNNGPAGSGNQGTVGDDNNDEGEDEGEEGVETYSTRAAVANSTMSTLDLAVAAVHPLSYGLDLATAMGEASLLGKQLPVWSSLDEILEKLGGKLQFHYDEIEGLDYVDVNLNITLKDNQIIFTWINENGEEQTDYSYVYTPGFGVDAEQEQYLAQFVEEIVKALNQEINGSLNYKILKDLNDTIADINYQLSQYNAKIGDFTSYIQGRKEYKYAEKLYDYYAKVAERLNRFLVNPNHYLQVAAIYSDVQGHYHHVSTKGGARATTVDLTNTTETDPTVELLCASYTGDVVVPSYLKYVAVTAVNGEAATAADNEKAGSAVNVVFPGQEIRVPVKVGNFENGDELQLTYVSVDYAGVCSMQNFYLKIVK